MDQQKKRSRKATKIEASDWNVLFEDEKQEFIGYDTLEADIKISRFRAVTTKDESLFHLVFNLTPFFPESGGQIGDVGCITSKKECVKIIDTKKENNLIIHVVEKLPEFINEEFMRVNVKKKIFFQKSFSHTSSDEL